VGAKRLSKVVERLARVADDQDAVFGLQRLDLSVERLLDPAMCMSKQTLSRSPKPMAAPSSTDSNTQVL
jgi:hypothetical protein